MDCTRILSQIASLSADELSPEEALEIRQHLADCPPCNGHWLLFEQTLLTLSTTSQPLLSVEKSSQIWLVCLEHAQTKNAAVQNVLAPPQTLDSPDENLADEAQVVAPPFRAESNSGFDQLATQPASAERFAPLADQPKSAGRFLIAPRWGWALVSSAAAALGAAYLLSPSPVEPTAPRALTARSLPPMNTNDPGELVMFSAPPRAASSLIEHHSVMGFDPFADHVGTTLVSSSAAPQR